MTIIFVWHIYIKNPPHDAVTPKDYIVINSILISVGIYCSIVLHTTAPTIILLELASTVGEITTGGADPPNSGPGGVHILWK